MYKRLRLILTALFLVSCLPTADTDPDGGAPPPMDDAAVAGPPDAAPALLEIRATVKFQTVRTQYGITCFASDAGQQVEIRFEDLSGFPHIGASGIPCSKPELWGNVARLNCSIRRTESFPIYTEIRYLNLWKDAEGGWFGQLDVVSDGGAVFSCDLQYEVLDAELIWSTP